jgi:hypothetical protein
MTTVIGVPANLRPKRKKRTNPPTKSTRIRYRKAGPVQKRCLELLIALLL